MPAKFRDGFTKTDTSEKRISSNLLFAANLEELGNLYEGDMIRPQDMTRNHINSQVHRWPNGEVPYVIEGSFSKYSNTMFNMYLINKMHDFFPSGSREQNYLNDALAAFNTRTGGCVKWIPRTSETNYVAITSANTGCWSYVGLISRGRQELNLQPGIPGCLVSSPGIAEHEMLHSLGTWHEQSRPDRLDDISHKCCQRIIEFLISGISMSESTGKM